MLKNIMKVIEQARSAHSAWGEGSAKTKLDYAHEMRVLGWALRDYDLALAKESATRTSRLEVREKCEKQGIVFGTDEDLRKI